MAIWTRVALLWLAVLAAFTGRVVPAAAADPYAWPAPINPPDPNSPSASKEKKIVVDLSEQRVTAYRGSAAVMRFPVSTGRNGNTVVGSFRILDKRLAPTHARWDYTMPYWMGVYWVGREWENGFHALPVTPGGRELWGDLIGSPASDGCIVLRTSDMRSLYQWADVGTPVEIVE